MSLDERLRTELPQLAPRETDLETNLDLVLHRGRRARRQRAAIPPLAAAAVVIAVLAVGWQARTNHGLEVETSPSSTATTPVTQPATTDTITAPSTSAVPGTATSLPTAPSSTVPP